MMANHTEDVMIETPYTMILKRARLNAKGVLTRFVGYTPLGSAMLTADALKSLSLVDNLKALILPNNDPYIGTATITLTCPVSGCTIRYTTNGTTPTAASTLYSTPFAITNTLSSTIQAIAIQPDGKLSKVAKRVIYHKIADDPVFSPNGGTISPPQTVMITSSSSATIRYTVDGSTPTTTTGTIYTVPVTLTETTTIKAIAYYSAVGGTSSAVVSKTFTAA